MRRPAVRQGVRKRGKGAGEPNGQGGGREGRIVYRENAGAGAHRGMQLTQVAALLRCVGGGRRAPPPSG